MIVIYFRSKWGCGLCSSLHSRRYRNNSNCVM